MQWSRLTPSDNSARPCVRPCGLVCRGLHYTKSARASLSHWTNLFKNVQTFFSIRNLFENYSISGSGTGGGTVANMEKRKITRCQTSSRILCAGGGATLQERQVDTPARGVKTLPCSQRENREDVEEVETCKISYLLKSGGECILGRAEAEVDL